MEIISKKVRKKIKEKILDRGRYLYCLGKKPKMSINEFKFIVTRYRIKGLERNIYKKDWWQILKELERDEIVKLPKHKRHIEINLKKAMTQWAMIMLIIYIISAIVIILLVYPYVSTLFTGVSFP